MPNNQNSVILALGSNEGDRKNHLQTAYSLINNNIGQIEKYSAIYSSKAQLTDNAPAEWDMEYLNSVVIVSTDLTPEQLLSAVKKIEFEMGRNLSAERWSPRPIDIDIIAYNNDVISSDELTIPHPMISSRNFVLQPLVDVDSDWIHPILKKTAKELYNLLAL